MVVVGLEVKSICVAEDLIVGAAVSCLEAFFVVGFFVAFALFWTSGFDRALTVRGFEALGMIKGVLEMVGCFCGCWYYSDAAQATCRVILIQCFINIEYQYQFDASRAWRV